MVTTAIFSIAIMAIATIPESTAHLYQLGLYADRLAEEQGREKQARFVQYHTTFLVALSEGLAGAGLFAQGFAAINEAIERVESNDERWILAELLRIKGELLLLHDASNPIVAAEDHFQQSLDWARRQGVLSWELRAATSLARLWHSHGRTVEARALLAPVSERFSEGLTTGDLRTAKTLLDAIE